MVTENVLRKKEKQIMDFLAEDHDLMKLKVLSIKMYGLVNNDIRKIVWPKLVKSHLLPEISKEIILLYFVLIF